MKFDSRSADAFGQIGVVVDNAGLPNAASLTPWHKDRPATGRTSAMLAFAAGLLVASLGAGAADDPAQHQPTGERVRTDNVRVQPTAPPNQPDVSARDSRTVDELYRQLIGPPPAISSDSRLRAAPNDDAAGSIRPWASPR